MNEKEWVRYRRLRFAGVLLDNAANESSRALALKMLAAWGVTVEDVENQPMRAAHRHSKQFADRKRTKL